VDSDNQAAPLSAELRRASLVRFADYLKSQEATVTEQWLLAVRRDTQIDSSDRLNHGQLVDHLPRIHQECCEFLSKRDAGMLAGEARTDAREHGVVRWQHGYRIDEVLRELETFRRLIASMAARYGELHPDFRGAVEKSAHALIHQFFSEVTIQSVRQFVSEQQHVVGDYTQKLESATAELGRTNATLEQALSDRHRLTRVVTHELRNLLQGLGYAQRVWARTEDATRDQRQAASQIRAMEELLSQLLQHSELIATEQPLAIGSFDPVDLYDGLVREYAELATQKGLKFNAERIGLPSTLRGDLAKVRQLAANLISNAIRFTPQGEVSLSFSAVDPDRWLITVADSGPGLSEEAAGRLFGIGGPTSADSRATGAGLGIAKDLVQMLGGSLQVITRAGTGTRIDIYLPRVYPTAENSEH
jgi:signal transduction histidine kinase